MVQVVNLIRVPYFLLFVSTLPQWIFANPPSFGICDLGAVITSFNGSVVKSNGEDCIRVLLAPKAWRIRLTVHDIYMASWSLNIYDGGTTRGTIRHQYYKGVNGAGDVFYSSSNAVVLQADRVVERTRLNISFSMFPQPLNRCTCSPVSEGFQTCTVLIPFNDFYKPSTTFFSGPSLQRHCKASCNQGFDIAFRTSPYTVTTDSINLRCRMDDSKANTVWTSNKASLNKEGLELITCSKLSPVATVLADFTFDYSNTSCDNIDMGNIKRKVKEHLVNNRTATYTGECYRSINISDNPNCTVTRLNISCLTLQDKNISQINLRVKDNVQMYRNETTVKELLAKLVHEFDKNLSKGLKEFVTKQLRVNNQSAANFIAKNIGNNLLPSCPANSIKANFREKDLFRYCVSCPLHYQKANSYFCSKCPDGKRRNISDQTCVPGERNYQKPSFRYCQHTCELGKFFNNNSGLCEWCPYGSFQNSTTAINPMCKTCPSGKSTGFVGAKSESDCIHICHAGQYLKFPDCIDCPVGYYMPHMNNQFHKCYPCSSGKTTLGPGTRNESGCVEKCSRGKYFNVSTGTCTICPNNTYQDEVHFNNTRRCKDCPIASITVEAGAKAASECLGPCLAGSFLDVTISNCSLCPNNTYQDATKHTSFVCKSCGKYQVTLITGASNISECIYACKKGEFFNKTRNLCEKCAVDSYQDDVGKDFCIPCPHKSLTLKTGSKKCIKPCQFGQFLNKSAEQCQDCPNGYYQNISEYTSATCFLCPLDHYNDKSGRRNCTTCPDQTITVITGATNPSECIEKCRPGTFLNKSKKSCQKCAQGFYQDQQQHRLEHCTKCPLANLTTFETGASNLEQCVGYCESSPCLNGGECTNIDNDFNCTCPRYLIGKSCEKVIDEKNMDIMEISVRFPNLVWNQGFSRPESEETIKLANNIEANVRQEFKNDMTFRTVKVKELRPGSVISDLDFSYVAGVDFTTPVDILVSAIADGTLGNLTTDNSSVEVVNYTCTQPLGMENGRIPDKAITSANKDNHYPFANARLNTKDAGWTPDILYLADAFLQVDLGEEVLLTGVATQGSSYKSGSWLYNYFLNYSSDGRNWMSYKEDASHRKLFKANEDVNSIKRNDLKYPLRTRYVRIIEYRFEKALSFRIEFYGCPIPKALVLPTLIPPQTVFTKGRKLPRKKPDFSNDAYLRRAPSFQATDSATATDSSTDTDSSTNTDSSTGIPSSDADDADDDDSNVGLIVGLVLGIFALFVLVAVGVWWIKRNKRSHNLGYDSSLSVEMKKK